LLEKHADAGAQRIHVGAGRVNRLAVKANVARHAQARNQVGEAVYGTKQRALARAGRADDAEDLAAMKVKAGAPQ
jgi:hypothetical protein